LKFLGSYGFGEIVLIGHHSKPSDLSYGYGIYIQSDDVTLDLMGFTLSYTGSNDNVAEGIFMAGQRNVEVRNGTLSGWWVGIYEYDNVPRRAAAHRIINVRIVGQHGVYLSGWGHLIQGCQATSNGQAIGTEGSDGGFNAEGTISDCVAKNFKDGILNGAGRIIGNEVTGNSSIASRGIFTGACVVMGNVVKNCSDAGIAGQGSPASIIGNTVSTSSISQTGIYLSNAISYPALLDQNTVTGPGTHYNWGASSVQWRNNAGYP
jgi:hypothetical protein